MLRMFEPRVFAIAHRGASAYAPENTVAAFDEAVRLGALAVEFDVRLTADGVPVVLHDETLDRTTSGRGRVDNYRWLDLLRFEAGSWFAPHFAAVRIPTLEEAFAALAGRAAPVIELKVPLDPVVLTKMLDRFALLEDAVVLSFEPAWLKALRRHTPALALGLLTADYGPATLAQTTAVDADYLVLSTGALGPQKIADAKAAGLEVWAFTANDVGMMAACAALGVVGIITDRPDLIRRKA